MTTTFSGALPFIAYAALVPALVWRARRRDLPVATLLAQLLLGAWVAAIIALTLFPLPWRSGPDRPVVVSEPGTWPLPWASITPFTTIRSSLEQGFGSAMGRVLIGNIVAFVPLGFLVPLVEPRSRSWLRVLALGVLVSGAIELGQLGWDLVIGMPWRSADVDDVIVNAFGTVVGYAAWRAAELVVRRRSLSPA